MRSIRFAFTATAALWLVSGCGSGGSGSSSVHLSGFWYQSSLPTTRGTFTADLTVSDGSVAGTLMLVDHPRLGALQVSGSYSEGYDSPGEWNGHLEFRDTAGRASFSVLIIAGGLDSATAAAGTLAEPGQETINLYLVPAGVDPGSFGYGFKVDFPNLERLAVSSDGFTVWADGTDSAGARKLTQYDLSPIALDVIDTIDLGRPSGTGDLLTYSSDQDGDYLWFSDSTNPGMVGVDPADLLPTHTGPVAATLEKLPAIPAGAAFDGTSLWALFSGYPPGTVVAFDTTTGSPPAQGTALSEEDLYALTSCGGHLVALQRNRTGYLDTIWISTSPVATTLLVHLAPFDQPASIACSNFTFYVARSDGWILTASLYGGLAGP